MTYKELQNQLKTFKSQGLTTIALNGKKEILENEYNRIMNKLVKDAINSEYEDNEDCEAVTITEDLIKEVSALEIASEDLVNEIEVNPPLELIEDSSIEPSPENNLVNETIEAITPEIKEAPITLIPSELSSVSITESTLSNSESMVTINEAVTNPPVLIELKDTEVTSKEFFEALSKLLIIFVSSIVKLWVKVNRISQLSKAILGKVKEARADIKGYWQWFIKGFNPPSFV
jgi:hypothetical protein